VALATAGVAAILLSRGSEPVMSAAGVAARGKIGARRGFLALPTTSVAAEAIPAGTTNATTSANTADAPAPAALVDRLMGLAAGGTHAEDGRALAALHDQLVALGGAAVGPLLARIDDPATSASARELLFQCLRQLPGTAAADRVRAEAIAGKQPAMRTMAIETLAARADDQSLQALSDLARSDPELPAAPLLRARRAPGDTSTELPDERTFTPRMQAMAALATIRDPRAAEVLQEVLRAGPDESLRMEAARDLARLRDLDGVTVALQRAATSDPSAYVRLAALHALAGANDPDWLPTLRQIASADRDAGNGRQRLAASARSAWRC
jgi:hypothetical protein